MSILDKPLTELFPKLNSHDISLIRELMKREYERGKADTGFTVSEPTPMNYSPNVDKEEL